MRTHPPLTQIRLGVQSRGYAPAAKGESIDRGAYGQEEATFRKALLRLCPESLWHHGSYSAGCPRPILVGKHHQQQMQDLHEALTIALADIVQRWWTDADARFPQRMPLEADEEELLKWMDGQVLAGNLAEFGKCLGSWRPDFLVEDEDGDGDGDGDGREESYRITEINARFSFNGFMHEVYGQEVLNRSVAGDAAGGMLVGATDSNTILQGLFDLFQPGDPLHILKGEEQGIDVFMFVDAVWRRFGIKPRLITPADLRLWPNPHSKSGYRLCCVVKDTGSASATQWTMAAENGEIWEEISQVGLELHQRELAAMEPAMLHEISLRCFNDMRTILLVHDKRMLGIVRQELPSLARRKVLTSGQADALRRGVVETILPCSGELDKLILDSIESPEIRQGYILKPIRSGKGDGIVFGEDMGPDEWVAVLQRLSVVSPQQLISGISVTCVVQRRIMPRKYDLVLDGSVGIVRYPLVGTYHVTNGKLLGLGTWRASGGRIVAVSSGGSWICSVMRRD